MYGANDAFIYHGQCRAKTWLAGVQSVGATSEGPRKLSFKDGDEYEVGNPNIIIDGLLSN
jgi:hypothetical protein